MLLGAEPSTGWSPDRPSNPEPSRIDRETELPRCNTDGTTEAKQGEAREPCNKHTLPTYRHNPLSSTSLNGTQAKSVNSAKEVTTTPPITGIMCGP